MCYLIHELTHLAEIAHVNIIAFKANKCAAVAQIAMQIVRRSLMAQRAKLLLVRILIV